MDKTSNAVASIQAAIIEDLGDPTGIKMHMRPDRWRIPPRCRLLSELQGVAFMRSFHGDPDQIAWEACRDPIEMLTALALVGEEPPIRVATRGVTRFVDETRKLLLDKANDVAMRNAVNYLEHHLRTSKSLRTVLEAAVGVRALLDQDAVALAAHHIWLALPVAPHRFSGCAVPDDELVKRLGVLARRLQPADQRWLEDASYRVLRDGGELSPSERERVDTVLRSRGPWHIFVKGW